MEYPAVKDKFGGGTVASGGSDRPENRGRIEESDAGKSNFPGTARDLGRPGLEVGGGENAFGVRKNAP